MFAADEKRDPFLWFGAADQQQNKIRQRLVDAGDRVSAAGVTEPKNDWLEAFARIVRDGLGGSQIQAMLAAS